MAARVVWEERWDALRIEKEYTEKNLIMEGDESYLISFMIGIYPEVIIDIKYKDWYFPWIS